MVLIALVTRGASWLHMHETLTSDAALRVAGHQVGEA